MNLNVFQWPLTKRYYLTHPWKWIKELGQNIRAAWSRATKGYCGMDVWNYSDWFLSITPAMFRHLADHGSAYPGRAPFDTPEKWSDWLHSVADALDGCTEEFLDTQNEYRDDYFKTLLDARVEKKDGKFVRLEWEDSQELRDLTQLYRLREEELWKDRNARLKDTIEQIVTYFDELWD